MLFFHQSRAAALVSGLNLVSIYILEAYYDDRACQMLMLVPLFRLLNLSVPLLIAHTIYPYLLTYAMMTIPIYLIIKRRLLSQSEMGIAPGSFKPHLPMTIAGGLILGVAESYVLSPVADIEIKSTVELMILTIILAGFVEEFIFRSAVQTVLEERLGLGRGLLVASLLFGIMYSIYGAWSQVVLGSFSGLVYGFFFQRTRSLPLVFLAHVISNALLLAIAMMY